MRHKASRTLFDPCSLVVVLSKSLMDLYTLHSLCIPEHWNDWLTPSNLNDVNRLRDFLIHSNMTGRMLATQHSEEDRSSFFKQLAAQVSLPDNSQIEILFNYWVDLAVKTLPTKRRLNGEHASPFLSNIQDAIEPKYVHKEAVLDRPLLCSYLPLPSTKRRSRLSVPAEETANQRSLKEQRQLQVWSNRLYNLYEQRDAPIARQVDNCLNPGRATMELAGATRYKTLQTYVNHWYRFESFLQKWRRCSWPTSAEDYVDYLHMLADEPCGPSVPESFVMAARFIEKRSGLPAVETFADAPLVKAVLSRTIELLKGPAGPTKRAPRIPCIVIEALEGLVMDLSASRYLRGIAWIRLLKVWSSMRFSCHNYLSPSRLTLFEGELFGTLKKTKTTGPSRRIKELPIHVSKSAYIRFASWLRVGFELWQTLAPFERDYFLPKSAGDGQQAIPQMAEYSDAASSGLEALAILKTPNSHELLLDSNWCPFFTEHSERPTLVTALVVLQSSKEERDIIGRWKPEGSDVYIRTYHAVVSRLQARVAEAMRSQDRYEKLQEKEIAQSFQVWCKDRYGLTRELAESVAEQFTKVLKIPPQGVVNIEDLETQTAEAVDLQIPQQDENSDSSEEVNAKEWFLKTNRPENRFVLVRNSKGQTRLHRSDGCWIARYRALKFPTLCTDQPNSEEYDFRCRLCWPNIQSTEENSSQESSSGEEQQDEEVESGQDIAHQFSEDLQSNWSVAGEAPQPGIR